MPAIELEILIAASPGFIWRYLGDVSKAPKWHDGVTAVSFLTTQREGKGARWRYSYQRGADVIIEALAWYDTVGYEYTVVDGAGIGPNQGRIRLTEVTDGTKVRWTLNYEAAGMLGGLRSAVRFKGRATRQIEASLRNLQHLSQQDSGGVSPSGSRATVRQAPDVEKRREYKPRHPSALDDGDDEGTAPREQVETRQRPDAPFLGWLPSSDADDTKPNPVILGSGAYLDMDWQRDEIHDATEPIESAVFSILPDMPEPEPVADPAPEPAPPPPLPPVSAPDSSGLSVFEVFGLRKPSELEDELFDASASMSNLKPAAEESAPMSEAKDPPVEAAPVAEPPAESAPMALSRPEAPNLTPNGGWRKRQRRQALPLRVDH